MQTTIAEQLIDVRTMTPKLRHPTIFNTWAGLPEGGAILLVNDHDPVPLFHQFTADYSGTFEWLYLEQGPEVWRVRITKGLFPSRAAIAAKRGSGRPIQSAEFVQPVTLDVRPLLARGETPCRAIDETVATLIPGQSFVLLAPFEPVPLYAKLRALGFQPSSGSMPDGTWCVEFRPAAEAASAPPVGACCCSDH